jgi:hypothetical protein
VQEVINDRSSIIFWKKNEVRGASMTSKMQKNASALGTGFLGLSHLESLFLWD